VDELIQEFLVESNENLDRFDGDLVTLEGEPRSKELLSSIFRSIHSIKGACGFLGFQKLEKLAHAGENLLSKLRDGQLGLTAEIGSALLEAGDRIREMLAAIGETGADGEQEFQELIKRLKALQEPDGATKGAYAEAPQANPEKRISLPAPAVHEERSRTELVAKDEENQAPQAAKAKADREPPVAEATVESSATSMKVASGLPPADPGAHRGSGPGLDDPGERQFARQAHEPGG